MKSRILLIAALVATAGVAQAGGDAKLGAMVFKKCQACHTATDATNKVGPNLKGIVGRAVATVDKFKYSDAMKKFGTGKVWDEATLATYLKAPKDLVPGTKMAFPGLKKPDDVANVIAYLKDPASAK